MKNLIRCVLSAVLLSSLPAFALTIAPLVSEAEKVRNTHRLFIGSKKVALERLEKYGFIDIKNSGKYECYMDDDVFGCRVIHRYYFTMKDNVFTKVHYDFNPRFSSIQSTSTTLSKDEKDELINVLNMATDNPQMSEIIIDKLVQDYHAQVAKKETIEKGWHVYSVYFNYYGVIIELTGSDEEFIYLYVN
ncbi:hypothetical protein [Moraxella bovis]|uniref:hypothetical protein n=1 Tax=Moraxella bovis TaxID=476 RepID=UPI000DC76838|nr:hypothetical protein [Moraxella bovis]AWY20688.1 hypothetical protein DQF64_09435 [Moraxella bovis]UYZ93689.1 hypothetical protein LP121_07120 [Moraxella bovis]UZA26082.1 hypothetical protein LP117_06500 [Moraxella bovis]UZA31025.1 hypothetical protein LP097_05295 [Moraxella bovis]